ncbi:hypothetical protein BO71DRAFT_178902 [Aspergillus ellipticus CBS 707.79]|uniref:Uncharacterized protein n=1 Tax=Aspergillus ellipticus CBS 707.79 TaxID=1448320 RepID=A0A319DG63_9EURO|nr:hypothetical protein BO71DRAFT_178902 [Aspergillus ellipticus CBS 707.79]
MGLLIVLFSGGWMDAGSDATRRGAGNAYDVEARCPALSVDTTTQLFVSHDDEIYDGGENSRHDDTTWISADGGQVSTRKHATDCGEEGRSRKLLERATHFFAPRPMTPEQIDRPAHFSLRRTVVDAEALQ